MGPRGVGSFVSAFFLLLSQPAAADPALPKTKGWVEVRTENFSVFGNASPGKVKTVAYDMERFREVLGQITKGFDFEASVPTSVFAFKNDFSLQPYKLDAAGKPGNIAGYFLERPFRNYIALDLSAESSRSRVIYHEYVHSLLHETFGRLPLWLDEGLAEYYSTFRFNPLSNTAWIGDPIDSHLYRLDRSRLMGFERLFSITTRSPEYNEGLLQGKFYAQSWMLVHYLVATDARRSAFGSFLGELRAGADPEQALLSSLGSIDLPTLSRALEEYMSEGGSGNYRITLADDVERVQPEAVPMAEADVLLQLGELLAHRGPGQVESARDHLEAALELGAAEGAANRTLGLLAELKDDSADAERRYRSVLDEQEDDPVTLTRLGLLLLRRVWDVPTEGAEGSALPGPVREARDLFRRALEQDKSNVEAMAGMGRTYLFDPGDADLGLRLLAAAATLRADRTDIVADLARLLAHAGRRQAAWVVIDQQLRKDDTDAKLLANVEEWAVLAELRAADERMQVDDLEGATEILDSAARRVRDPSLLGRIEGARRAVQGGSTREDSLVVTADSAEAQRLIERHNEAVRLVNDGKPEPALRLLDETLADCGIPEICEPMREVRDGVSAGLDQRRQLDRFADAIGMFQQGERKKAIEILRELESRSTDEEFKTLVRNTLDQLAAR